MIKRVMIAVILLTGAGGASGHRPTVQECREAGEFIRNAALARDAGMTRERFMDQLRGDLMTIRNYPAQLRWFAQDEEDETFLLSAAESVFDQPLKSLEHETDTLRSCLARIGAGAT